MKYDIIIVGAGILGLSHAYAAAQKGLHVLICEKTDTPLGASIRNFGFAVLSGQKEGEMLALAKRSREIWNEWHQATNFHLFQNGSLLLARNEIESDLLEAFMDRKARQYNYKSRLLSKAEIHSLYNGRFMQCPAILHGETDQVLYSREAIPTLVKELQTMSNITFQFSTLVKEIDSINGIAHTSRGDFKADHFIICSGHDYQTLLAKEIATLNPITCRLQMLRVRPQDGLQLKHALLTGLSTIHYGAYANLEEAQAVFQQIQQQNPEHLENGIHLLVSPTPYGELIIGDSHHYQEFPTPFNNEEIDNMLLGLAEKTLGTKLTVIERWSGEYGAKGDESFTILQPTENITAVLMRAGVGMSVGPALAEKVIASI